MRARTAAILLAGTVALAAGAVLFATRWRRAEAAHLLRAAYADGRQVDFVGRGRIGLMVAGQWTEQPARIAQAAGKRRIEGASGRASPALLDDGNTLWRLQPENKTAVAIAPTEPPRQWGLLLRNYRLRAEGVSQVAGRPVRRVALVSRRARRAAVRLWIDRETKVPLRTDSYDADGHLVARTELDSVDYATAEPQGQLQVPEGYAREWLGGGPAKKLTVPAFTAGADFTPRPPAYIPGGYADQGLYGRTCPHGRQYAEFRYRDGLRTLSVFERHPLGRHGQGRGMGWGRGLGAHAQGAPVVIDEGTTKSIRARRDDLVVVVTGDLPAGELVRVLESVPAKPGTVTDSPGQAGDR